MFCIDATPYPDPNATQEDRQRNEVGDMLAYVNDKLVPHGFDDIVKDDFAALRQMLQGRR